MDGHSKSLSVLGVWQWAKKAWQSEFSANSVLIPWWFANRLYSCGFRHGNFSYGKKSPAEFPDQGICH